MSVILGSRFLFILFLHYICIHNNVKVNVMKRVKYLLVIAVLFSVSAVNAQLRFGAKGGLNIAKAEFNKDAFRSDNVTGFHVGPTIEAMFGKGGLGFDAALLYSQKGFYSDDETVRISYLEVPVNLKFKLGMPLINPYVAAGPYVGFRVSGDEPWNVGIKEQIKAKSFGAGLNFSVGAELFDKLQLGLNYSWGLTDNYETFDANDADSYKGKAHTWSVSAVFFF